VAKRFASLEALAGAKEEDISAASLGEGTAYRTLGDKAAAQLAEALAKASPEEMYGKDSGSLRLFLENLRLPGFGGKKAEAVARRFGDIDSLRAADAATLAMTEMGASQVKRTLGGVAAKSIRAYLDDPDNRALLNRLADAGVATSEAATAGGGAATNKVFVLTGTLPGMGRAEAKRLIEAAGGLVAGSVSRKVDYVVAGAEAGSKLDKARERGIAVIDGERLLALCAPQGD
jgi:DNA ligase (NAD+)